MENTIANKTKPKSAQDIRTNDIHPNFYPDKPDFSAGVTPCGRPSSDASTPFSVGANLVFAPLRATDEGDGRGDRPHGVRPLRPHRRGDQDSGREMREGEE